MKNNIFSFLILISLCFHGVSQNTDSLIYKIPAISLKTLKGTSFNSSEISNNGKPFIIIFWKSCCSPNLKMLDEINEVYPDWQTETGVILYAVSIDDSKNSNRIAPLVNGKGWTFEFLLDINSDFKRAMNVVATPHVFIFNGNNELIWQKTTYNLGDSDEIYPLLKKQ
ncbi:MAG TPA: TlpA disulfide reductase family protein [Bacteroidales bacterium]|nr:TlpA disulfide reductase family protein [Bacteroidales bacterium]HQI45979.1 TlpA disulfide reductase family protein [Bacteroidales bacterium]